VRIGIFGHVGNQNLGDEALIAAVVQNVQRRCPGAEVCGFTGRPRDTEQRHRIVAFPIRRTNGRAATTARPQGAGHPLDGRPRRRIAAGRRLRDALKRIAVLRRLVRAARRALAIPSEVPFLITSYRRLRGTRLLLVAGSAQFSDYWGGPWGFPFTLFKWALLARATGTKVALLSLGAGPLKTRLGRFFVRQTMRLAHYCSFRDDHSRRCIVGPCDPPRHPVVPDLVFSLALEPPREPIARTQRRVVGINPMPLFDHAYWPEHDQRLYQHYLQTLASFADWLVDRGYDLRFFPTQLLVDPGVIDAVRGLMRPPPVPAGGPRVLASPVHSFGELVSVIDGADLVVATRYHGAVFALIRGKPVLSIAYQPKTVDLMAAMGLRDCVLTLDCLTLAALQDRFVALEGREREVRAALRRDLPALRQTVATQYDRALALVGGDAPDARPIR